MVPTVQSLVDAHLHPDEETVIRDAVRSLLQQKPQLRVELAIHRYQTEDISLGKAAHLAGISFDQMKALLVMHKETGKPMQSSRSLCALVVNKQCAGPRAYPTSCARSPAMPK